MTNARLLFGSDGWPCGLHEIASQVSRLGLGEVVVHRLGESFWKRLVEFQPQIVGFRIEGGQFETVCENIRKVRRRLPDTKIVLGGPTATSHPVEVLEETDADYVFAGDAEESFTLFLQEPDRPESIRGLAYRKDGYATVDLSGTGIPYVDEHTLRENRLDWSLLEGFDQADAPLDSLYLTGGRGCPGRCTFCARLHGNRVRTKTASQIIEEVRGADALVRQGKLRLTSWPLYRATDRPDLRPLSVSWCSVFDEDFFLDRSRAVRFFQLFEFHGFQRRYRLGFQTNPRSLLDENDRPDAELFYWISRLKAMIQVGAESFHPALLRRWKKRHTVEQLETALDALEQTGQDYNVFHLASDYRTTLPELRDSTSRLLDSAARHPAMRIASSPFMIPLYDTEIRRDLERRGVLKAGHFTDYERPHPEWMDPDVAEWADRIDAALQATLHLEERDGALARVRSILNDIDDGI